MAKDNLFSKIIYRTCERILSVPENPSLVLENPRKFIIIRQHNQLGDLLIGVSLFRAIKERYPHSSITLIVSPFNYPGLVKNRFVDRIFIFDKKKLLNPSYLKELKDILREERVNNSPGCCPIFSQAIFWQDSQMQKPGSDRVLLTENITGAASYSIEELFLTGESIRILTLPREAWIL
jgi:hypothetical protein